MLLLLGIGIAALTLAGAVLWAWRAWPPLVRYRCARIQIALRATTDRYLQGTITVAAAASELARGLQREGELSWATMPTNAGGVMTPISSLITPIGHSMTDPRITQLVSETFVQIHRRLTTA